MPLHAGDSHHIAGIIEFELRLVEHIFRDFAHVADQMRHESIARIKTPIGPDRIEFRQFVAMRFDEGLLILSNVFLEKDRLVLRHGGEVADASSHFVRIQMQSLRDQVGVSIQVTR